VPELPDITLYVERLRSKVVGVKLTAVRIASPFVLRSVEPPVSALIGLPVSSIDRLGKRIVLGFASGAQERFVVLHLMIAGRLRWREVGAKLPGKLALAAFDFATGTVLFTEASKKKRASLHVLDGRAALASFDRGGLDVMTASASEFAARLRSERHTLKRALTDPTLFDGIGNAYSDEILHAARISPFRMTTSLDDAEAAMLAAACVRVLAAATALLRAEVGDGFPETVCMANMASRARYVATWYAGSSTQKMKPTTARSARPRAGYSPTDRCPDCCATTGRARSRRWKSARRNGGRSSQRSRPHRPSRKERITHHPDECASALARAD
jgi:formamidopyrimidine-DNA glycosylase